MTQATLNGKPITFVSTPDTPLLWAVRDELKMTGTKFGCGAAQCGACTVYIDGQPTRSCVTPIGDIAGKKITTIEGLDGKVAKAVVAAWQALDVAQCGYCQSGQIMAATALLSEIPKPSEKQINDAMSGNICRCATYVRIKAAIKQASAAI
jgi:isoquinoline 1-oxidoreductase subunit alpha